jgi:hypothetical protein
MTHPKLLDKLNWESKIENNGRIRNWSINTSPNSLIDSITSAKVKTTEG